MKPIAKTLVMIALFIIGISLNSYAQCEIGELEATPAECDSSGYFDMIINFDYANTGSQGFTIQGNGIVYGTWNYTDLPVIIYDLYGDGTTFYEFVARDVEFPDCSNYIEYGIVDCFSGDCEIGELVIDDHPCDSNGMFYVYFNFEYANVSDSGFVLYINNSIYGAYFYEELPIGNLGPFEGDGVTEYHFLVRDADTYECASDENFGPIDCNSGGDCHIWDLVVDDHPCEEGEFYVLVDFEYEDVSEEGFALYVNNEFYEEYDYDDLPLNEVGPFEGDGSTIYHFVVYDLVYDSCLEDANVGPIECDSTTNECEIGEIDVTILPCNDDDEFFVLLDFDYANTSDEFTVQGNGIMWGTFLYEDVPVQVGPLTGDGNTVWEFAVIDVLYPDCAEDTHIDPVSCDSLTEFTNFSTQVISCDNGTYELSLNFNFQNAGNQGFTLHGNNEIYGSYTYEQLPVTIGPLETDGTTAYHFIAKDKENPVYGNWDKLIPFTCESLGIIEPAMEDVIKVYPNPSNGTINFVNLHSDAVQVKVYNSTGAEAISFIISDKYQLNDLRPGMYFYILSNDENVIGNGKLIVTE